MLNANFECVLHFFLQILQGKENMFFQLLQYLGKKIVRKDLKLAKSSKQSYHYHSSLTLKKADFKKVKDYFSLHFNMLCL